mgnify:CR=1 FL=1
MSARLFTSESVTEGHPDKICDQISDSILDAMLAQALMSIQAVKGVEIGDAFEVAGRLGSAAHDPIRWDSDHERYTRLSGPPRRWAPSLPSIIRSKRSLPPSMQRIWKTLSRSRAAPRQSKPGPTLAVVAGT